MHIRKIFCTSDAALTLAACGGQNELTIDEDGALKGKFTVDDKGTQVQFSCGNLQYVGDTWRFAYNQWDYFGEEEQYDNHRDLFGWGTGEEPNKVSTNYYDYTTFTDWGINPIINGGKKGNKWRTPSKDEWVYLFYTRDNAVTLFGLGTVNDVNGVILLPDDWKLPDGASFTASTTKGLSWSGRYFINDNKDNFSHNTYTIAQWKVMEKAGAVFLPAGGRRVYPEYMIECGLEGYYWSSTPEGTEDAHNLNFHSSGLYPQTSWSPHFGFSVRLVR